MKWNVSNVREWGVRRPKWEGVSSVRVELSDALMWELSCSEQGFGHRKRTALDRYKAWLIEVMGAYSEESKWYGCIDVKVFCVVLVMQHVNAHLWIVLEEKRYLLDLCACIIYLSAVCRGLLKLLTYFRVVLASREIAMPFLISLCCTSLYQQNTAPDLLLKLDWQGGKGHPAWPYPIRRGGGMSADYSWLPDLKAEQWLSESENKQRHYRYNLLAF